MFVSAKPAELLVERTAEAVVEPVEEPAALNLSFHNNRCSKPLKFALGL